MKQNSFVRALRSPSHLAHHSFNSRRRPNRSNHNVMIQSELSA